MKIYFAHSVKHYNLPIEMEELRMIRARYPDAEIINPRELGVARLSGKYSIMEVMKQFAKIIDSVDVVVAFSEFTMVGGQPFYSGGVMWEMAYAFAIGKQVVTDEELEAQLVSN